MSEWRRLRGAFVCACVASVSVAGCSNIPIDLRHITIRSDPPGAEVLANNKKLGVTPLTIVPDHDFPPAMDWQNLEYRAMGELTVRKPGCQPYSEPVNDAVLSKDIMVRLECTAQPPAVVPTAVPTRAPAPAAPAHAPTPRVHAPLLSAAQRLRRLERLRKDGLITDKEYREIRARILNGL